MVGEVKRRSVRQVQITIHSWEGNVYKVSTYPGDASKAHPLIKLNVSPNAR